jgi:hypothetical protein
VAENRTLIRLSSDTDIMLDRLKKLEDIHAKSISKDQNWVSKRKLKILASEKQAFSFDPANLMVSWKPNNVTNIC